jgi:hypothetical protein
MANLDLAMRLMSPRGAAIIMAKIENGTIATWGAVEDVKDRPGNLLLRQRMQSETE